MVKNIYVSWTRKKCIVLTRFMISPLMFGIGMSLSTSSSMSMVGGCCRAGAAYIRSVAWLGKARQQMIWNVVASISIFRFRYRRLDEQEHRWPCRLGKRLTIKHVCNCAGHPGVRQRHCVLKKKNREEKKKKSFRWRINVRSLR